MLLLGVDNGSVVARVGGHEVDRWRRGVCEYECWELDNDVCCDLSPDSTVSPPVTAALHSL